MSDNRFPPGFALCIAIPISIIFWVIVGVSCARSATIEDHAEPVLIQGPDVRLIRYADAPGDPEPLYTRVVDGRETGFVRDGDQCMDGKLGGAVIACKNLLQDEGAENVFDEPEYRNTGTVPSAKLGPAFLLDPSCFPFCETPIPHAGPKPYNPPVPNVPIPGAAVMLIGALATLWRFRK